MSDLHPAIQAGKTAVVTGGANGIGFAAAKRFAAAGMTVMLIDRDGDALAAARQILPDAITVAMDVTSEEAWATVTEQLGDLPPVTVLMNNAGASINPGPCWEQGNVWRKQIDINFYGILNGVQAVLPQMIGGDEAGLVINTGSKQGLTKPPGNSAYNVSKAAVIAYTECLAHDLRNAVGDRITAHLLIPGFVYSNMIAKFVPEKPAGAWTTDQTADFMIDALVAGDFYILCPDNDVPRALDEKRLQWTADDIIKNRPALSRWHNDYEKDFAAFVAD